MGRGKREAYNTERDPARKLSRVLWLCHWEEVSLSLWRKGTLSLYVDQFGIFLYVQGVRTHGLTHTRIRPGDLRKRILCFGDGKRLNLETGELSWDFR